LKLSNEEVRKIARLARLGVSDEELEQYAVDLTRIVGYIEKLSEVNVDGISPSGIPGQQATNMRDDEVRPCLDRDLALSQAPDSASGLFRVRAVLPTQEDQGTSDRGSDG